MPTLQQLVHVAGLDDRALAALGTFVDEVVGWRGANITGLSTREDIVDTLVGDALALLGVEEVASAGSAPDAPWFDLGSGAGVPGIPLSIALPAVPMWLLESVRRKCDFLEHAVRAARLRERVRVVCARSEDYARVAGCRESGQLVLARAVGSLPTVVELAAPLLSVGGHAVVCTSAARAAEETAAADRVAEVCGLAAAETRELTRSPVERSVAVVLRKVAPAPGWLPRRAGLARRRPLGG